MIYQAGGSPAQITYSDLQSPWSGVGNIFTNPLFVSDSLHDYHLQSSSPCIDAGNLNPIYNDPDGTLCRHGLLLLSAPRKHSADSAKLDHTDYRK